MALSMVEQYRRWFEYEKDSHRRVLESLDTVPEGRRGSAEFSKAMSILAHIVAARRMWLFRFGGAPERPASLFPTEVTRADLLAQLEIMERGWSDYFALLTETELERDFHYQSYDGPWFRNRVADVLTQLYGHSLYHRGQVASLVRAAGGQPVETDFIFWSREPSSTPTSGV